MAVISYTGYDMEDAMIVNKASYDRGFGAADVYKTKSVSLAQDHRGKKRSLRFSNVRTASVAAKRQHAGQVGIIEPRCLRSSHDIRLGKEAFVPCPTDRSGRHELTDRGRYAIAL